MKKNLFFALLVLFSALAVGIWIGFASSEGLPRGVLVSGHCRTIMDGTRQLQRTPFADHLRSGEPWRKEGDFDPNQYFEVYTHLRMAEGFVLDFVYVDESNISGYPLLYAREVNSPQIRSYYDLDFEEETNPENLLSHKSFSKDFLEKITPDGTPESYFEFLALRILGRQFYLYWHSGYDDTRIVCDANDLQSILQEMERSYRPFSEDQKMLLKRINPYPVVDISGETVFVRIVTFSQWGGFYESIYTLDRNDPTHVLDFELNKLLYYNCGIVY